MKKSELEDIMINTKDLFMAEIRFYDAEKGLEREDESLVPKTIIYKRNNECYGVVINERFPLVKSSKITLGNYIPFSEIKNPELMDEKGICYVEVESSFIKEIKKQDKISIRELEDRMLNSDIYFKDRTHIIEGRMNLSNKGINKIRWLKFRRIAHIDCKKNCHFRKKLEQLNKQKKLAKIGI